MELNDLTACPCLSIIAMELLTTPWHHGRPRAYRNCQLSHDRPMGNPLHKGNQIGSDMSKL